jgi:hypothetical protein
MPESGNKLLRLDRTAVRPPEVLTQSELEPEPVLRNLPAFGHGWLKVALQVILNQTLHHIIENPKRYPIFRKPRIERDWIGSQMHPDHGIQTLFERACFERLIRPLPPIDPDGIKSGTPMAPKDQQRDASPNPPFW